MSQELVKSSSCRGSAGKRRCPRPINRHASIEAAGFLGARRAPYLTLGFASKPSPSAPWARGLLSAFWERGSQDLPTCGPWRGYASRPYGPSSSTRHSRPSRGAKPREADDARPPQERPHQAGFRGAESSSQGKPREVPMT